MLLMVCRPSSSGPGLCPGMEGDLQRAVGRNLRAHREAKGLSQEAFADELGALTLRRAAHEPTPPRPERPDTAASDASTRRKLLAAADEHLREISIAETSSVGSERSARELRGCALPIQDVSPQAAERANSLADSRQREEALPIREALGRELRE
jgi:transcriptional regulator with XRE-family HTH domain